MNLYKHARLSGIEFTKSMLQMDHDLKGRGVFPNSSQEIGTNSEIPMREFESSDEGNSVW